MICPYCGCENKEGAKFCNECGQSLADMQQGPDAPVPAPDAGSSEFDFSPIGGGVPEAFASQDADGSDEHLVDPSYRSPEPNWKSGDTTELPPVEGSARPRQQQFRAPDANERKGRRRAVVLIVVLVLVLAGLGIGAYTYFGGSIFQIDAWGAKSLPDVVGLDRGEAARVLEEEGFTVKVMEVKSDDVEGIVLLMDPNAGRRLSDGSEVVLQVATPRVVPSVVGMTEDAAREAFGQEGLERVEYVKQRSDEPEGTVLLIKPAAGEKATRTTQVTVTVAEPYTVVDTIGMDADTATGLLQEAGYEVYQAEVYSDQPVGTVVSSDPAPGTQLESGSTVTIYLSKSRADELIAETQAYLSQASVLVVAGTTYELLAPDEGYYAVSYIAYNTTQVTATVIGVTTLPDGEVVRGAAKQRTITFVWNDDDTISYLE